MMLSWLVTLLLGCPEPPSTTPQHPAPANPAGPPPAEARPSIPDRPPTDANPSLPDEPLADDDPSLPDEPPADADPATSDGPLADADPATPDEATPTDADPATPDGPTPTDASLPTDEPPGAVIPTPPPGLPLDKPDPSFTQRDLIDAYQLSGVITCDDCDEKILIRVEDAGINPPVLLTVKSVEKSGPYTIQVPKDRKVIVMVIDDANNDGMPTPGEALGLFTGGLIDTTSDYTGVDLTVGVMPEVPPLQTADSPPPTKTKGPPPPDGKIPHRGAKPIGQTPPATGDTP